jgi:hypothetical protein
MVMLTIIVKLNFIIIPSQLIIVSILPLSTSPSNFIFPIPASS